jgi:predicted esterase
LNLHGAGLEADTHQVRHMLDDIPDIKAWVLYPTGMSPWSGDDWHTWGLADVRAAVLAIPEWIRNTNWTGSGVDTMSWVVTGHSNGGQGAWFISTHYPDRVIATAAVSGYSSIQNYVPYTMWREASPLATSTVHNSLSSYRHELLVENLTGIPAYQQHGSKDDNVPPYHSRLLKSLLHESGSPSHYVELPNRGHWFEGAMTTKALQAFYSSVLNTRTTKRQIPSDLTFIIPNSADVGSRAGISVDQLQSPDNFGTVRLHRNDEEQVWRIETANIHRMHFLFLDLGVRRPRVILVDETPFQVPPRFDEADTLALVRLEEKWSTCDSQCWKTFSARYGRQRGSLDAILRTTSLFRIKMYSAGTLEAALQISRNLLQYYGADAELVSPNECSAASNVSNMITLITGQGVPPALMPDFPIQITADGIKLRRPYIKPLKHIAAQPGLGAAFVRPLLDENLELVLWGFDDVGLQQAVRMVPTITGAGQPDFIVLGNTARWKGLAGALAMGFFDHAWQISQASYLP